MKINKYNPDNKFKIMIKMNIQDITNLTTEITIMIILTIIIVSMIKDIYPFNIRRKKNEEIL